MGKIIKKFLYALLTGMVPNTLWNEETIITGGLILVDKDLVLIKNEAAIKNYLFNNSFFDSPSSSKVEQTDNSRSILIKLR